MATADRILQLKLVTDATSATKGVKTVQKDMTRLQKTQGRVSSGFKSMGLAIGALGAVSIGVDILKTGIEDFFAGEKAAKDFERQIALTSTNVPRDMERMADAMERALSVNVDDTEFQNAVTGIIRQLKVNVPRAIRVAELAADLAAAGVFPDFASAVKGITGALQGKKRALMALGLPTDKVISDSRLLELLERKYGQAAEENVKTLPGRWEQIQLRFKEFVEGIVARGFELSDEFAKVMTGAMGPDWLGAASGLLDASAAALTAKLVAFTVPFLAGAQAIGDAIFGGITGETEKIPGAVGEDIATTEEVMNEINILMFRNKIKREVDAALAQTERLADQGIFDIDRLEAKLRAVKSAGSFGPIVERLLPKFGEGGIVTRPTLALIGEKGPEAVIPLGGGSGMGITVNVSVGVGDPVAIGREVDRVLRAYRGRAGLAA